jgi:LysR family hydrogen peroxide-inducible transcriptional activator
LQLHQLEYVLAVARHHSFTRAAEEIKIAQSSLSQQVSNLEKELGVDLFVRTTRSVYLSSVGEDFVEHAIRIMSEVRSAQLCIQEYVSIDKGHLNVGLIPVVAHYPIPKLLADFNREFPGVKLSLIENQDDELLDLLSSSKLDAAIVQQANLDAPFQFFPLYVDEMVLLTSNRHPLAFRKSVDLKELKNEKFIVTPSTSGHHHDFEKACNSIGLEPNIIMTCSSVKTIMGLTSEGIGISVLSSKVATGMGESDLAILRLTPKIERRLHLAIPKGVNISPTLKVFVKFTSQWIKS